MKEEKNDSSKFILKSFQTVDHERLTMRHDDNGKIETHLQCM